MHPRRTHKSLRTCSVDLSGPHEPTSRPGAPVYKNSSHYSPALTFRPDLKAQTRDIAAQASDGVQIAESVQSDVTELESALTYAAPSGIKSGAAVAIKHVLAQINNDHANFPMEIRFRLHIDKGGGFVHEDLDEYCRDHGIQKTFTAGYDLNANAAATVGILERRSRYLLSRARLATNWWGFSTSSAAQCYRADAGLEEYARIPFGTRVTLVRDPPPRNAFVP